MSKALDKLFGKEAPSVATATATATAPVPAPVAPIIPATEGIREIPIDMLVEMDQPFRRYLGAELEAMRQSISVHGIIQRIIVRPMGDLYQIISGRNRSAAARLAGYVEVPCEIRNLTDDEAQLQMLETNLQQREKLLPSEKAWAYRLHLEASNRQGFRTDLTPGQYGHKSRDTLAMESNDSSRQIQRFVRLTYLLPSLLGCVDVGRLGLMAGETLSYLTVENQSIVYHFFFVEHPMYFSEAMANTLREAGDQAITEAFLQAMITTPPGMKALRRISMPVKPLRKFFVPEATPEYIAETIEKALVAYFKPMKP